MKNQLRDTLEHCIAHQRTLSMLGSGACGVFGVILILMGVFIPAKSPTDENAKIGMMIFAVILLISAVVVFVRSRKNIARVWYLLEQAPDQIARVSILIVRQRRIETTHVRLHERGGGLAKFILLPGMRERTLPLLQEHLPNADFG